MRGTRWLLLAAILGIVCAVGLTYRAQKKTLREQAPPKPAALPENLNSTAQHWSYTETTSAYTKVEIEADDFRQAKDSGRVDLRGVVLKLHDEHAKTYNLVKSAAATFFQGDHRFFSDGAVEITLDVPEEGAPKGTLVSIQTAGVSFDTTTGRAETDRDSTFVFPNGTGKSVGALYDPGARELLLKSNVALDWKPAAKGAKPMKIEGASMRYKEESGEIWLMPWGKLTRENTVVEGEDVVVHLEKHAEGAQTIRKVDARKAHGTDNYPRRKLQYSADELWIDCDDTGDVTKITAQTNAKLRALSDTSEMNVSAFHVEMNFSTAASESVLTHVSTSGDTVVSSRPLPAPNRQLHETHILKSDKIGMEMRPNGRDIDNVVTHTPGTLEFLPNQPVQRHRTLEAKEMQITYGADNRIQFFRGSDVQTRTEPNAEESKRKRPVSLTSSKTMQASFEPKTGRMTNIEQAGDFTYEEGDRRASAAKATLDAGQNVILLETAARVWDSSGATSADRIRMDQRTDDFTAEGHVNSSRIPDKAGKNGGEILSGDEPLQAQAAKMVSANRNRTVHYEGGVAMWQGANRIEADTVDLDREEHTLVADGHVITNLWEAPHEAPKDAQKKKAAASPVLTEVRAARMVYTEQGRLAHYTGGVVLKRPHLEVAAREIRAFLDSGSADSTLEKAFADGSVKILMTGPDRTRTGTSEHAEYYAAEQKVILRDGTPRLVDTRTGTSTGAELTYWANDDRLLVNGSPTRPAESRIRRQK